jgi:hypothetical protein
MNEQLGSCKFLCESFSEGDHGGTNGLRKSSLQAFIT